jgi:hypothetical protein
MAQKILIEFNQFIKTMYLNKTAQIVFSGKQWYVH